MAMITCENVSFAYEGRVVVEKLNLKVERGDYLCIAGENGSGKSTLVKGLLGLLSPVEGSIVLGDGLKRNEIGYLPQRMEAQRDFPASVWEVVSSGCHTRLPFLPREQKEAALRSMQSMGVADLQQRSFAELSGGQQQRVLLARALCATKKALLLDEPVAGLSPVAARELYQLIDGLHRNQGLTILMISHDLSATLDSATRVLHLGAEPRYFASAEEYAQSPLGRAFAGGTGDA